MTNVGGRAIIAEISFALEVLSKKLAQQQRAAACVVGVAVRAEEIARNARRLAFDGGSRGEDTCETNLVVELEGFAADLRHAVDAACRDALMGAEVAKALLSHSDIITKLAREVDSLEVSTIRAQLRPLSLTLSEMPATQRAGEQRKAELLTLAERAEQAATTAASIAKARPGARREMIVGLARSLVVLSEEISTAAIAFGQDAELAARAAETMASRARRIAEGERAGPDDTIGSVVQAINGPKQRLAGEMDWGVMSGSCEPPTARRGSDTHWPGRSRGAGQCPPAERPPP